MCKFVTCALCISLQESRIIIQVRIQVQVLKQQVQGAQVVHRALMIHLSIRHHAASLLIWTDIQHAVCDHRRNHTGSIQGHGGAGMHDYPIPSEETTLDSQVIPILRPPTIPYLRRPPSHSPLKLDQARICSFHPTLHFIPQVLCYSL